MSPHKRNKLKAKRTPWVKSRYSANSRALQGVIRAMVLHQGLSNIKAIQSAQASNAFAKVNKAMAMASASIDAMSAVSKVPLYGSKTV